MRIFENTFNTLKVTVIFFSNFLRIESKQILQHSDSDSGVLLTEKILKTIRILLLSSQL